MLSKSRREAYFWNRLGSDDREFEESLSDRAKDYFSSMLSGDVESKKKCEILLYSPERSFWAGNWTDAEARIYQEGRGWKAKARFPGLDGDGAAERLERLEKELDTFYTSRLGQKQCCTLI
ncbi:MAG: hypothetical protein SVV03_03175 [Candidatus Nanohaloarchaea archaeon]|nr:hypothetical protein [Candidatus Nanohaloarchaea archaeon]